MPRTLLSLAIIIALAGCGKESAPPPPPPASQPTSKSATTVPTSRPVAELKTLLDVVRADDAKFPTTQPLAEALELSGAARLRMTEPTYLCSRGDLWITRGDAPPTTDVLAAASSAQTHVVRERVKFVYWRPTTEPWSPELIASDSSDATTKPASADVWITATARLPLDPAVVRDWTRAGTWNTDAMQAAVVPTATGMSIIRILNGKIDEQQIQLLDAASPGASTQFVLDMRGLLAWSVDPTGPSKVARFLDGKWTMLTPDTAWPEHLVQVVPFLDGTVLSIAEEGATLKLKSIALDTIGIDEANVNALVKQLVNHDPKMRETAQADLAQVGPGAWALLRKLAASQPPEARIRIRAILGNETTPTLGGITPVAGPARVVCRLPDGGVVLHFVGGASAVNANGVVQSFAPAWLAVRPGEAARRLPESLNEDLATPAVRLSAWGDEWIVDHDVDGPKRWMGNHTEPLVKKSEAALFKHFGGIDAMGRWIFKTIDADGPTLIVDPTLPDPKPRLPVWTIDVPANTVGWNDDDWAVMRRGGAWVLREGAWQAMKGDVEKEFHTALDGPGASIVRPATQSTTPSTTLPTTQPSPLLTDADGNRYFGGLDALVVETKDGRHLSWPLPAESVGEGIVHQEAVLLEADGKLFLCNSAGKLQRLTKQLDQSEPFKLDAVFSRNIPGDDIRRFWKDPAGRLIFASGGTKLAICFPSGRIPNSMSNMIPAVALRKAFEEEAD